MGKVRFESKAIGMEGVAHNITITLYDPRSFNDKLTILIVLRQEKRMASHFLILCDYIIISSVRYTELIFLAFSHI